MLKRAIKINDILEVTSRGPSWDGLRIKVLKVGDNDYDDRVHGIVTKAVDSQPRYPVGVVIKMFARRFSLYKREKPREIEVGDLVEVHTVGWEGIRYKVAEITKYGLFRGYITVTNEKQKLGYPIGKYVGFYPKSLMLVERDGEAIKRKTIFAKKGGWGP